MFPRFISKCTSKIPSGIKYRLKNIKPAYSKLVSFGSPVVDIHTRAGSFKWQIDELTSQRFILGEYEPYMQDAFVNLIKPGFTVYEIGTHAGFHAVICSKLVGPAGCVFAFEPNPTNRDSIQRQIAINRLTNLKLMECAVGDRDGRARFNISNGSSQGFIDDGGQLEVEVRSLDSLSSTLPPPDLLKIDVEGHEEKVVSGGLQTIKRHLPLIVCDPNDDQTADTLYSALQPLGYDLTSSWPIILENPRRLDRQNCSVD